MRFADWKASPLPLFMKEQFSVYAAGPSKTDAFAKEIPE